MPSVRHLAQSYSTPEMLGSQHSTCVSGTRGVLLQSTHPVFARSLGSRSLSEHQTGCHRFGIHDEVAGINLHMYVPCKRLLCGDRLAGFFFSTQCCHVMGGTVIGCRGCLHHHWAGYVCTCGPCVRMLSCAVLIWCRRCMGVLPFAQAVQYVKWQQKVCGKAVAAMRLGLLFAFGKQGAVQGS